MQDRLDFGEEDVFSAPNNHLLKRPVTCGGAGRRLAAIAFPSAGPACPSQQAPPKPGAPSPAAEPSVQSYLQPGQEPVHGACHRAVEAQRLALILCSSIEITTDMRKEML